MKSLKNPFYLLRRPGVTHSLSTAQKSIEKLAALDANDYMLLLSAHDTALRNVLDFWPQSLHKRKIMGWK